MSNQKQSEGEVSEFARTQAEERHHSHTPGPWQSQHEFDWEGFCTIIGNLDGDPASPTYTTICDINEEPAEYIANRNLIVAAPDLYAALKNLIDSLNSPATSAAASKYEARLENALAALSKAEGL